MGSSARMDRSGRFVAVFQEMFQKAICVKDKLPEGAVKFEGLYFNGGCEDVRYTVVLYGRDPDRYVDLDHEAGCCYDPDASDEDALDSVLEWLQVYEEDEDYDTRVQQVKDLFVKAELM